MDYHRVKGRERLKRQIRAIPETVKEASRNSLIENAKGMSGRIRLAAPMGRFGTSRKPGTLKRSVGWTQGDPPKTKATGAFRPRPANAGALRDAGLRVTIFAGNDEAFYPRWVEFGTKAGLRDYQRKSNRAVNNRYNRRMGLVGKKKIIGKRHHPGTKAQPFFYPVVRLYRKSARSRMVRAQNKAIKALRTK